MNLLVSLDRRDGLDEARIIGQQADEGERLTCEGCGALVKRLYEDDGMNMLCPACIALMA